MHYPAEMFARFGAEWEERGFAELYDLEADPLGAGEPGPAAAGPRRGGGAARRADRLAGHDHPPDHRAAPAGGRRPQRVLRYQKFNPAASPPPNYL